MKVTAELLLAAGCETGEGPVWDAERQVLWWTDIPGKTLHRCDATGGNHETFAMPGRVGCFALRRQGGLVLAMEHGFTLYDPASGRLQALAEPEAGMTTHRFNDGRCDREGRFLAGSMNLARDAASARLWRLDADHRVEAVADDCTVANGLAFSPDGRTMYWVDGGRRQVFRFDYDADGRATNRRVWLDNGSAPGNADGAAIDSEGCYWSARWGGGCVVRFTPEGRIDRVVDVPVSRASMCAFGGRDLKTLYITTAWEGMTPEARAGEPLAGGIFAVAVDVAGIEEPRFTG